MKLDNLEAVLEDFKHGKPVVLVDDADRENEGDLTVAAEKITPDVIAFMLEHGKGLVCLSLTQEQMNQIAVPMQVTENSASFGTNFGVSFDHISVSSRGVTAEGRAKTILRAIATDATPEEFVKPGFVVPVCAQAGGVLKRRGQTEGSVDLSRLAGLLPAGVICEVMAADGTMLRGDALVEFCRRFDLKLTSIEAIKQYRLQQEVSIRRVAEFELPPESRMGRVQEQLLEQPSDKSKNNIPGKSSAQVVVYVDDVDDKEHFALVIGKPRDGTLVRIHSECLTGDVFDSSRCDCGEQLDNALSEIFAAGEGVLVYLYQEGRGIGLGNKLRAYELQERGRDTVDANVELGFGADERDYRVGAQILKELGLSAVRLMTNNPQKVEGLNRNGITVSLRVPLQVPVREHNASYMETKRTRLGHILP